MNKIKVLVVDDHTIMREGIHALLIPHDDIEIVGEASEGKEAIEKAQELGPDIIIMDISMPGMDGLEATRRILKQNKKIKILVLTQHDNREYVLLSIKAGVSGYIPKKALASELVSAIRSLYRGESFLYPAATTALIEDYLRHAEGNSYDRLTSREREVLKLIAEGHTSRKIAEMLYISLKTVLGHRSKISSKLDIHNRTELIKYAMQKGLISIDE